MGLPFQPSAPLGFPQYIFRTTIDYPFVCNIVNSPQWCPQWSHRSCQGAVAGRTPISTHFCHCYWPAAAASSDCHQPRTSSVDQGKGSHNCTSIYADNDVIFLKPILTNVNTLTSITADFGEASRMVTNFNKFPVVPIRCPNIGIDLLLTNLPVVRAYFTMRYLGLLLSTHCLWKLEFQFSG
jgi:hypothetical protein